MFIKKIITTTLICSTILTQAQAMVQLPLYTDPVPTQSMQLNREFIQAKLGHGQIEFESMLVEQSGLSIAPGSSSSLVGNLKQILTRYDLVSHTQLRENVLNVYDEKLQTLIHTLSEFCSYYPANDVIDDSVRYIIENLNRLSPEMIADIKISYQRKLESEGTDGTVMANGCSYGFYVFTQTDPEWGDLSYGGHGSIASSACGPTAMATILSQYFNNEILPTEVADFSVANGHRYATGTSTELFADAAKQYGMPIPVEVGSQDVDAIYKGVKTEGQMAIALMGRGAFTRSGHYVVLVGTEERDGEEYFLVSDPNYPNNNYKYSNGIIDDDPSDALVLAKKEIFENETKGITWFQTDFYANTEEFHTQKTEILLTNHTEDKFSVMIPIAVSGIISENILYRIAKNKTDNIYYWDSNVAPTLTNIYAIPAYRAMTTD